MDSPADPEPVKPVLDTCSGRGLAWPPRAAQSTVVGEEHWNQAGMPQSPVTGHSPAASHTSCGLGHPPCTQAAESSRLTSGSSHFRERALPSYDLLIDTLNGLKKASSLPRNYI